MFGFSIGKWLASLFTPPATVDTTPEVVAVERDIEEAAQLVEDNIRAERVRRARAWVGKGLYCLGAGPGGKGTTSPLGMCAHPKEHSHASKGAVFCDCSGFVNFVIGTPRKNPDSSWNYTDSWESRAKKQGIPWTKALPGDVVVYGAGAAVGHCGIVVEVDDAGPVKVVHCNAGAPPAVDETDESLFVRKGAVIWRP